MSLLESLMELQNQKSTTGFPCSVSTFLASVSDDIKDLFNSLLENPTKSTSSIHKTLIDNNYKVALTAVYKHRRKQCRCFI